MTPAGIEPATFRFVAQHLNHCASTVLISLMYELKNVKVFTRKFVGSGSSSFEKTIYRTAVSQMLRDAALDLYK